VFSDPYRRLHTVLMRPKKETESITELCKLVPGYWPGVGNVQFYWATPLVKVCSVCIIFTLAIKGRL